MEHCMDILEMNAYEPYAAVHCLSSVSIDLIQQPLSIIYLVLFHPTPDCNQHDLLPYFSSPNFEIRAFSARSGYRPQCFSSKRRPETSQVAYAPLSLCAPV
eukprot:1099614-Pelagomonas_calceolata.AAC.1